jgi:hypothetical protein
MEILIVLIGLCALAFLSLRYGYDSRATVYSKEEEFARYGVLWDSHLAHLEDLRREAALWRLNRHVTPTPAFRLVRQRTAEGLRALARRLNPELAPYM